MPPSSAPTRMAFGVSVMETVTLGVAVTEVDAVTLSLGETEAEGVTLDEGETDEEGETDGLTDDEVVTLVEGLVV